MVLIWACLQVTASHRLSLARDAAPSIAVTKARVLNPVDRHLRLSGLRSLLEDCLKVAGLDGPWPRHWQRLLDASLRTSGRAGGGYGFCQENEAMSEVLVSIFGIAR